MNRMILYDYSDDIEWNSNIVSWEKIFKTFVKISVSKSVNVPCVPVVSITSDNIWFLNPCINEVSSKNK